MDYQTALEWENILDQFEMNYENFLPPLVLEERFRSSRVYLLSLAVDRIPLVSLLQEQVDSLEKCPICLVVYTMGHMVMRLKCGHFFDSVCLRTWFRANYSCPLCRDVVKLGDYIANGDEHEEGQDDVQEEEEHRHSKLRSGCMSCQRSRGL